MIFLKRKKTTIICLTCSPRLYDRNFYVVVSVESKWININAKWSDVGHENRAVAKLFSTLRHQDYAWGTVDALVEMQFHRETFFSIKQDQLCKILGRELRYNKLNSSTNFTVLDDFCRTNIFVEIRSSFQLLFLKL